MREFVCGHQTLLTCGSELIALGILALCLLAVAGMYVSTMWREWRALKRTPHPESCRTPLRCDGRAACWQVPSCKRNVGGVDHG